MDRGVRAVLTEGQVLNLRGSAHILQTKGEGGQLFVILCGHFFGRPII